MSTCRYSLSSSPITYVCTPMAQPLMSVDDQGMEYELFYTNMDQNV